MTTRRSIFKCIPAMIAAAVLPKAWTARASEPVVPAPYTSLSIGGFPMVGETGPETIRQAGPAIRVYNDLVRDGYFDRGFYQPSPAITSNTSTTIQVKVTDEGMRMVKEIQNRPKIHAINGPIRIYVDDQYGGTAELSRAISAEFTIK